MAAQMPAPALHSCCCNLRSLLMHQQYQLCAVNPCNLQASHAPSCRRMEQDRVRLRSEAEAPWRSLRLTLYGFSVASAGMGTLISLPQLIGALGGAPGALAVDTVLQNLAINLSAVGIFAFLFSRDWKVGQSAGDAAASSGCSMCARPDQQAADGIHAQPTSSTL